MGLSLIHILFFSVSDERVLETLKEMDIPVEEDSVIISRRMTAGRSVSRINGEIVSAAAVRRAGQLLMDIHGQHDHQSLLDKSRHQVILDRFIREPLGDKKEQLAKVYQEYVHLKEDYESQAMDNEQDVYKRQGKASAMPSIRDTVPHRFQRRLAMWAPES